MTHMWFSRWVINWSCNIKIFIHLIYYYLIEFIRMFDLILYLKNLSIFSEMNNFFLIILSQTFSFLLEFHKVIIFKNKINL